MQYTRRKTTCHEVVNYFACMIHQRYITFAFLAMFIIGCKSAVQVVEEAPVDERYDPASFVVHLNNLNPGPGSGRRSGTVGYATATNYVVSQVRAMGLHPGLRSGYDATYITNRNTPQELSLSVARRDSINLVRGIDFVVDSRTGTQTGVFESFIGGFPRDEASEPSFAVAVRSAIATDSFLIRLHRMGYKAVFVIGPLTPGEARISVPEMSVIQMTEAAFGHLLSLSSTGVVSILDGSPGRSFTFPTPVTVTTRSAYAEDIRESNLVALIPGRSPGTNQELVVLLTLFNRGGPYVRTGTFSFEDLGIGSAALIELAKKWSEHLRYEADPTPSIMFAFVGGSATELDGVRAFLSNSLWSRESIREILIVGESKETGRQVGILADAYGIPTTTFDVEVPQNFRRAGFIAKGADLSRSGPRAIDTIKFEGRERRAAIGAATVEASRLTKLVDEHLNLVIEQSVNLSRPQKRILKRYSEQE